MTAHVWRTVALPACNKTRIRSVASNMFNGTRASFCRSLNVAVKPRFLWFGVTDLCNSRCATCNIWRMSPCPNPLSPLDLEKILSDPLWNCVEYVINSGGEPSLRSDLKQILHIEHEKLPGARLQLSTNGILVERILDAVGYVIEELGCPIDVGVSLDGVGKSHDVVRGVPGNFERVDQLLHELSIIRKIHPDLLNVTVGSTLTDQTVRSSGELVSYAKRLNIPFMFHWFNQSSFYGNTNEKNLASSIARNAIESTMPCSLYRDMWVQSLHTGKIPTFNCFALYSFLVLKCNGDIAPCLSLWDTVVGNMRDSPPSKVWSNRRAQNARKIVKGCSGCLNSWGVSWSLRTTYYPELFHKTKRRLGFAH